MKFDFTSLDDWYIFFVRKCNPTLFIYKSIMYKYYIQYQVNVENLFAKEITNTLNHSFYKNLNDNLINGEIRDHTNTLTFFFANKHFLQLHYIFQIH